MARYVNLCFEVPEDLEQFYSCEFFMNGDRYCFAGYNDKNHLLYEIPLDSVHCSSGDMCYVTFHKLKFFNGNSDCANDSFSIWNHGVIGFLENFENEKKKKARLQSKQKKFPRRSRCEKA